MEERFVTLLRRERGRVFERIREVVPREFPEYTRLARRGGSDWEEWVETGIDLFITLEGDGREFRAEEAEYARAIGRARADQDFDIDVVANAIRVGTHVAGTVIAELFPTPTADETKMLEEFRWRLTRYANRLTSLVVDGYTERRQELARGLETERSQLVNDLLDGVLPHDVLLERADRLGLDLRSPVTVFLVPTVAGMGGLAADVRALAADAVTAVRPARPQPHVAIVVASRTDQQWRTVHQGLAPIVEQRGLTVVSVSGTAGDVALRRRYQAAAEALPFAPVVARGRTIVAYEDVQALHVVATASPTARGALIEALSPLADRGATLYGTLDALLRHDFGVKQTAQDLACSPRTIKRRMEQMEELTGLYFTGLHGPLVYALGTYARLLAVDVDA